MTDLKANNAGSSRVRPVTVVITGAESTGKTTLAKILAEKTGGTYVPESVRTFVDRVGRIPVETDVDEIATRFLESRDAALETERRIVFFDTDLISTVVYQKYYFGSCPDRIVQLSRDTEGAIYFLSGDEIAWEPDPGQRDGPEVRAETQQLIIQELERRGVDFVRLAGSIEDRVATAMGILKQRFPDLISDPTD